MKTKATALVIGAGIAGIAAAARLARQGYDVTVLEKNAQPGGRCGQLLRDGHRFDIGATLFLMPEVFAETYAALGERMEDHLQLLRVDPTYQLTFSDGSVLSLSGDLTALAPQLEALEPGSFAAFLRYVQEGQRHYDQALQHFVGRNFNSLPAYLAPHNLWLVWRMKALRKHYANVSSYFRHPHLRAAFTFQNMYLGLSPFEAPATYSLGVMYEKNKWSIPIPTCSARRPRASRRWQKRKACAFITGRPWRKSRPKDGASPECASKTARTLLPTLS